MTEQCIIVLYLQTWHWSITRVELKSCLSNFFLISTWRLCYYTFNSSVLSSWCNCTWPTSFPKQSLIPLSWIQVAGWWVNTLVYIIWHTRRQIWISRVVWSIYSGDIIYWLLRYNILNFIFIITIGVSWATTTIAGWVIKRFTDWWDRKWIAASWVIIWCSLCPVS